MTIAERNAEMATRTKGLETLDRANLVANFLAYWPGRETKQVGRYDLMYAIIQAEFDPTAPLTAGSSKASKNWK